MKDFSAAIRNTHYFNFVFLSLLVRSGIEILGGHPKLYWNDHCSPGERVDPLGPEQAADPRITGPGGRSCW